MTSLYNVVGNLPDALGNAIANIPFTIRDALKVSEVGLKK
jgi:hypothetical protein